MTARPTLIDLRSKSQDTMKSGLASPRLFHVDGDIPPQMSPLDAFAAQSRMLAKKLDDSKRNGRRVSRLPPLTIAESLVEPGQGYSRSRSAELQNGVNFNSPRGVPNTSPPSNTPDYEEPLSRPKSFYPRMSRIRNEEEEEEEEEEKEPEAQRRFERESPEDCEYMTPATSQPWAAADYFAVPRVASPEPARTIRTGILGPPGSPVEEQQQRPQSPQVTTRPSFDLAHRRTESQQRGLSVESVSSTGQRPNALAPPRSPNVRQAASIRSVPLDSSDDDLSASTGGSSFSQQRKESSSSGISVPHSPFFNVSQAHARSPSLNSEHSVGGSRLARPAFNFSRPLSRGSRPSMELASRQPSFDSRPSLDHHSRQPSSDSTNFVFVDRNVQTPASLEQEQYFDAKDHPDAPAPSYIYTKFCLPRGRILQRNSKVLIDQQMPHFEWEQPAIPSNVAPTTPPDERPSASPVTPPHPPKTSLEIPRSSPRLSSEKSRLGPNRPPPVPVSHDGQSSSSASMRSSSTIKARPNQPAILPLELTPEDHLAKGIASHETGNFKESTYHLRIAAKANLPTAMLLYALACRHGWGMRPNPSEGVQWLRRAADCASLEIADDEDHQKEGRAPLDQQQQKARRAQFALSIYELGVSHMNGWGIEQDKALALRCFEIAGNWGDADAMAEAGFCYAQGTGCKKDLMKAAKWYRMSEAKGMSMVGNSWIYKPKYADDGVNERKGREVAKQTTPEKKPRDKSRTRTIFGRKKSELNRRYFSFFTYLTFWGIAFYFLFSSLHTFRYALTGSSWLQKWPVMLQVAHAVFYTTIVMFPILVTAVYWVILYSGDWFPNDFTAWTNTSQHALNAVFAAFEIFLPRTAPPPPAHLPILVLILALYLSLAYISHATQGFYSYSFLDPSKGSGRLAGYILGILAAACVIFGVVWVIIWIRRWLIEGKLGMHGKFARSRNNEVEEMSEIERANIK
ncbi:MAG: hypothetical protein L6R35_001251 [Caloplaca aegaea]|nr:MAG: hypothetical protein L6R35_001251 [Caloplaca aegaea]